MKRPLRKKILDLFIHPIKRRIAKLYLFLLKKFFDLKVIGITGSAGKTTTKEMLASILRLNGKTVWTVANIDPVYNIPTTILKCSPKAKYLVLEMGVEYPGEMDFYLWLAKPDIGVITNIHETHTQFFGNIEGVLKEKRKLVEKLSKDDFAVLNAEDAKLKKLEKGIKAKIFWFGNSGFVKANNISLANNQTKFTLQIGKKELKAEIPVLGRQFVSNALAAATAAFTLGISFERILQGLKSFEVQEHRMRIIKHRSGALIIDDSYNNNPQAAKESLKTFNSFSMNRKKVVVMGDMLELGAIEEEEHRKLGSLLGKMNLDFLIGVGKASKVMIEEAGKEMGKERVQWFMTTNQVFAGLKQFLRKDYIILIKGSRSIGLDKVVNQLGRSV